MGDGVRVGTVGALYHFPVKSMRGALVEQVRLDWHGLAGDRRYAFVRSEDRSFFPWLTARQVPALLAHTPVLADPSDPGESSIVVRTPEGEELALESNELRARLAEAFGGPVHLMQSNRGTFDAAALSVIGEATVRDIGDLAGLQLEALRFRNNVLLALDDDTPYLEDGWEERLLAFGRDDEGARVRLNRRDPRCMMINLDPERATQDPAVLRAVVRHRDRCVGMYASTERTGAIRTGDPITLLP